jgi:membrane protein DedA with SNARE-associated domain
MAELSDLLLTYTVTYGAPLIFVALLIGAAGIPIPGTFLVLAAGAFVRQGVLDMHTAIGFALLGAVLGDSISYGIGRFARHLILQRFGASPAWQKAEASLYRRGGLAIYLTRWLFTPLAIPTNLVAGSAGYACPRFLFFDIAGEITWLMIFGSLGYVFSGSLESLSELISNFSGVLVGIALFGAGLFLILRKKHAPRNPKLSGASLRVKKTFLS